MKLVIIGNSHIGSLRRAWEEISGNYPSVEIVFFGSKRDTLKHMKVQGRKIVPTDNIVLKSISFVSGGRSSIDPAEFDVALIYGAQAEPFFFPVNSFYSSQVIRRTMEDLARGRVHFKLANMIRRLSDMPVYIGHTPLRAARKRPRDQSLDSYTRGLALLNEVVFAPMSVRMVSQPLETIVNGNGTDMKYTVGSRRLAVGNAGDDELHSEKDRYHMNEEFGKLWLEKFFSELEIERGTQESGLSAEHPRA